uniref:Thioredoxin domain-containing protein n=1 Tax=Heterorhabditis bacteriophora TaxID=37862 RepID=A0A1I7XSC8_HETBA
MRQSSFLYLIVFVLSCFAQDGVVELSMDNHDQILSSSQVVFVAFCADWCPFSRRLKPIFEESAKVFKKENPTASVVWAVVDSVRQVGHTLIFTCYSFLFIMKNISFNKNNSLFRSTRSVEALTTFVKYQLSTAINEFATHDEMEQEMDKSKRNIVAWIKREGEAYANLKKIAALLREECVFWVGNEAVANSIDSNKLSFIDPDSLEEQKFSGNFEDYEFLKQWVTDKCIPLVREVTFENVEELTEEGLPFLIFFRDPKKRNKTKCLPNK